MKFLNNIELQKNQIVRARLENGSRSLIESSNDLGELDPGYIMYDTVEAGPGKRRVYVWDGTQWTGLANASEVTTDTNTYLSSATIVQGHWNTNRTTFTEGTSASDKDWALKLHMSDNTNHYVDMSGYGVHLSAKFDSILENITDYTPPTSGDTLDTAIANLMARIEEIVSEGGEPNVINSIKINGVTVPPVSKAVDIKYKFDGQDVAINQTDPNNPYYNLTVQTNTTTQNGKIKFGDASWRTVYVPPTDMLTGGKCFKVGTIIGTGTADTFLIKHGLGWRWPSVSIWDVKAQELIMADVNYYDETSIVVTFATPPLSGTEMKVFIIGYGATTTAETQPIEGAEAHIVKENFTNGINPLPNTNGLNRYVGWGEQGEE